MRKTGEVYVIGSGIGGIAISVFLAKQGYKVTVFEKNEFPGGRCGKIEREGHRFDIGATLLMMTHTYEHIYQLMGKDLFSEIELYKINPIYKILAPKNLQISFSPDLSLMQYQLEKFEKGSFDNFLLYMYQSIKNYRWAMQNIIDRNFLKPIDFFTPGNLLTLLRINALNNHVRHTQRFFQSELLTTTFTFQNIYVGQNPFTAPAIFSMLPFVELTEGVYYPKGGMYRIIENLINIAKEYGVEFEFNRPVKEIIVHNRNADGLKFEDGHSVHNADLIIANADLPYVYQSLLPADPMIKRLKNMDYTCSALVFYWAMDKEYKEIEMHNVFLSTNYKENITRVFNEKSFPAEPSFYVLSPVKLDKTAAPDNQDSLTVIVPTGHLNKSMSYDWENIKNDIRNSVIKRLEAEGLSEFRKHIKFEICFTPSTWESRLNLTRGATFGSLSHNIMQMGYMRPHNRHKKYHNLYFVGGSTHPGNGLPMALLSAKLVAERIKAEHKL